MVTVETLFEKHTYYVALVKVLRNEIEYSERQLSQDSIERDEEIASMVLSHAAVIEHHTASQYRASATEGAALKLLPEEIARKRGLLVQCERQLFLYNVILSTLIPKEQWFVSKHYCEKVPMSQMIRDKESPFFEYSRSTVWRYKQRLLKRANDTLFRIMNA